MGNFDGVHLGHQAVIRRAVEEGRARGTRVIAATFRPHPREVLWPGKGPKLLTTPEARRELLMLYGADEVREIPFDEALSKKSPEEFVRDVLVSGLGAGVVVVGDNFRYGYRASGDFEDLRRRMREVGGEAYAVSILTVDEDVSSTRIRELVEGGEVREAAGLLGRPYVLRGEVVSGDQRGRLIGFPTANVLPDPRVVVPGTGVYAGNATVDGEPYGACTNVGEAPTFERRERRVEAYLIGFEGDLYGKVVDVSFVEKIRGEKKFSGIDELKAQIGRDVERARAVVL